MHRDEYVDIWLICWSVGNDALVAGNVCNTWFYDPDDPRTHQAARAMHAAQLGWAAEEGIGFVISEANDYPGSPWWQAGDLRDTS